MSKIKKASDGLANARAIIEKELGKILVKEAVDTSDRGFALQAFKLLSEEQQATGKAPARPLASKNDDDLIKLLGS